MRRRTLIFAVAGVLTLTACAWPGMPTASIRIPVVGYLGGEQGDFRRGMSDLGWYAGEQYTLVERSETSDPERLAGYARELVTLKVDVLVAQGSAALLAARDATRGTPIPVVFGFTSDPIALGIAQDLAHPTGNITGFGFQTADSYVKQVELLKEIVPALSTIGVLFNERVPGNGVALRAMMDAVPRMGIRAVTLPLSSGADMPKAFDAAEAAHVGAIVDAGAPFTTGSDASVAFLSKAYRIPTSHFFRSQVERPEGGGLFSFAPDLSGSMRGAAGYVVKILKGAKVADLPIQQPTMFELVINLRTAQALGLTISDGILARAQVVIR